MFLVRELYHLRSLWYNLLEDQNLFKVIPWEVAEAPVWCSVDPVTTYVERYVDSCVEESFL